MSQEIPDSKTSPPWEVDCHTVNNWKYYRERQGCVGRTVATLEPEDTA